MWDNQSIMMRLLVEEVDREPNRESGRWKMEDGERERERERGEEKRPLIGMYGVLYCM